MNRLYRTHKSPQETIFTSSPVELSGITRGSKELMYYKGTTKPAGWAKVNTKQKEPYEPPRIDIIEFDCTGEDFTSSACSLEEES